MMLLLQMVPFQLLVIPLYVMIVRGYGLADSYLGMILPFAINSTAVFVFRQYFLQLPDELFYAARIDGAGSCGSCGGSRCRWSARAAHRDPDDFIGPWNEFLWPFLVTKEQHAAPRGRARELHQHPGRQRGQPLRGDPGGRRRAGGARGGAVHRFQRQFVASDLGSGVKG